MYIETITLKNNIPDEELEAVKNEICGCYDNRCGCIKNSSDEKYTLVFQGEGEESYRINSLGSLDLWKKKQLIACIDKWTSEDTEEPEEYVDDVMAEYQGVDDLVCNASR